MNELHQWAADWQVPPAALDDLRQRLVPALPANDSKPRSEAWVQSNARLEAARTGRMLLFRNNVGAGKLENGNFVRWGLANDSTALNSSIKSADLIGIERHVVTAADVGRTLGVFLSIECKSETWKPSKSDEFEAQLRWLTTVQAWGGNAMIVNGEGQIR